VFVCLSVCPQDNSSKLSTNFDEFLVGARCVTTTSNSLDFGGDPDPDANIGNRGILKKFYRCDGHCWTVPKVCYVELAHVCCLSVLLVSITIKQKYHCINFTFWRNCHQIELPPVRRIHMELTEMNGDIVLFSIKAFKVFTKLGWRQQQDLRNCTKLPQKEPAW